MDSRNKDKLFDKLSAVEEQSNEVHRLLNKLIILHKNYDEMLESDQYPSYADRKKIKTTIKKVEKSLRIANQKLKYSYDRLLKGELVEENVIKDALKKD